MSAAEGCWSLQDVQRQSSQSVRFLSYLFYLFWGFMISSDVRPLEIGRAHHHGRHRRHQIGTFPVVPLNAVVAHHAGRAGVENAIQIGGATCLKPPSCRRNASNSWLEATWVQFKLMNRGIQTNGSVSRNFKLPQRENDHVYGVGGVFNKIWIQTRCLPGQHTSRSQLGAPAGTAVIVSVLGAELGAGMGKAAHPAGRAAVVLSVKTALCIKEKTFNLCPSVHACTGGSCLHPNSRKKD